MATELDKLTAALREHYLGLEFSEREAESLTIEFVRGFAGCTLQIPAAPEPQLNSRAVLQAMKRDPTSAHVSQLADHYDRPRRTLVKRMRQERSTSRRQRQIIRPPADRSIWC